MSGDFHIWGGVIFFHNAVEHQTNYLPPYPGSTVRFPLVKLIMRDQVTLKWFQGRIKLSQVESRTYQAHHKLP